MFVCAQVCAKHNIARGATRDDFTAVARLATFNTLDYQHTKADEAASGGRGGGLGHDATG